LVEVASAEGSELMAAVVTASELMAAATTAREKKT
jgi:hypothetical protein